MSPEGFEPAGPASERPQTHSLDRAATGSVDTIICKLIINKIETICVDFYWNDVGLRGGILRCVISVVCRKTNCEVNISHETTTMVVWIYDGI